MGSLEVPFMESIRTISLVEPDGQTAIEWNGPFLWMVNIPAQSLRKLVKNPWRCIPGVPRDPFELWRCFCGTSVRLVP